MKEILTIEKLIEKAKSFCILESLSTNQELYGVTDGKAVGTLIEHKFQQFLAIKLRIDYWFIRKGN